MERYTGLFLKRLGQIITGYVQGDSNVFDLEPVMQIYMDQMDTVVDQVAVALRDRIFFYPCHQIDRLSAKIIDTFVHRLQQINFLNIPVT